MIASLDGAITLDGRSGDLGGPGDHERFVAARRQADAIVVGSATVAIEDYRPTTTPIAVLTRTLDLDPTARLFSDPERRPLLFTTSESARTRGGEFDGIAEVIDLGDSLAPARVLANLHDRGMRTVVLEGGSVINAHFVAADLVDEALITVAPWIVGGQGPRLVSTEVTSPPTRLHLDRVVKADDMVLLRYLRQRTGPASSR